MKRVSIQIVTHNCEKLLPECLKAVFAQTYTNFSVIAVDNGSQDGTIEVLKTFKIPFFKNEYNAGYSFAHNQAFNKTKSDLVCVLNPDVKLDKNFLRYIVEQFDHHPQAKKIGSISGKLIRVEDFAQKKGQIDGLGLFMYRNRKQGLISENQPNDHAHLKPFYIFGPDGAAPVFKRKMLNDIAIEGEILDEDFFINKEDIDLCWRAQLMGWDSMGVPRAVAYHIRSFRPGIENRKRVPPFIRRAAIRNRYLMMLKNDDWRHILKDILPILWYECRLLVFLCIWEPRSLWAYIEVVQLIPTMLKKRQYLKTKKRRDWRTLQKWFLA